MVQSFDHECLEVFEATTVNGEPFDIKTIYLQNYDTLVPETYNRESDVNEEMISSK